jgi:hypothetical protein
MLLNNMRSQFGGEKQQMDAIESGAADFQVKQTTHTTPNVAASRLRGAFVGGCWTPFCVVSFYFVFGSFKISAEKRKEIEGTFDMFDADGGGEIDSSEFKELMASLGINLTEDQAREKLQVKQHTPSKSAEAAAAAAAPIHPPPPP